MKRPSKKEIQEAVNKLRKETTNHSETTHESTGKLSPKKSSKRIRKQGV